LESYILAGSSSFSKRELLFLVERLGRVSVSGEEEELERAVSSILTALDRLNKRLHDVENAINDLNENLGWLAGKGQSLQVENEVTKIRLGAVESSLLGRDKQLAEEVLNSLNFMSEITKRQITQNGTWNDEMLNLFQEKTAQSRKILEELVLK
jgi:regulator of replication initiation timing